MPSGLLCRAKLPGVASLLHRSRQSTPLDRCPTELAADQHLESAWDGRHELTLDGQVWKFERTCSAHICLAQSAQLPMLRSAGLPHASILQRRCTIVMIRDCARSASSKGGERSPCTTRARCRPQPGRADETLRFEGGRALRRTAFEVGRGTPGVGFSFETSQRVEQI